MSDATRLALRDALEAYLANDGEMDGLRTPIQRLAVEVRDQGVYAEQLLILLKGIWYGIPAVQQLRSPEQQSRLLQRVITVSIQAYYDIAPPAG